MQRNWIGRSRGRRGRLQASTADRRRLHESSPPAPTRCSAPPTCVLAPEHPLVEQITTDEQRDAVRGLRRRGHQQERPGPPDLAKDKTGVFTGAYAINPVNGEKIPIWIADYVLMGYGTGAIMAVPGARRARLRVRHLRPAHRRRCPGRRGDGTARPSPARAVDQLRLPRRPAGRRGQGEDHRLAREKGKGRAPRSNYKLRDWLFSRQRYWGEPFPLSCTPTTARSCAPARTTSCR
jgi:leucyl-tRNA synthetase